MRFGAALYFSAVFFAAVSVSENACAFGGRLSPRDFNKMYYLASQGKIGILREAVNRGLNIDATNPNGDTGLCIAIKRKNYVAYNSFRMSGANPRHACTYEINKEYREFLESSRAARTEKIVGNEESLYYNEEERSWWPWLLGGAAVGGAILAFSGGGGGGSAPAGDDTIVPTNPGYGLASLVTNTEKKVNSGGMENNVARRFENPDAAANAGKIQLLPNVLDNVDYLMSYVAVSNGAYFNNLAGGSLQLGDATIGASVYGDGSKALNNGNILIDAQNGSIGMAASNGGQIINSPEGTGNSAYGNIDISFKGTGEGHAVAGMYGDTGATIINSGRITGTTSAPSGGETGTENGGGTENSGSAGNAGETDGSADADDTEGNETVTQNNSGTILGMVLFDLYTGTDFSNNTVTAENRGIIDLSAGYNSATDVAVSLVGMGSYIDDEFLNGKNNPAFAEKMKLNNYGDINLSYQGAYKLADTALKMGQGGLIGIRADAATEALNRGNIKIDLTSTTMAAGTDVAAGMLSVHGGELTNGNADSIYNGTGSETGGTIRVVNEATSGGVSYGMLAAKGKGSQTRVYDWKDPKLHNYGLIDMQASNAYGMASFAGGEVVNYGVINLGVENGQSRYKNNYGLYAAGEDKTDEVLLQNKGIINVYSEESTAIYNAFSGSVEMVNDGYIYLSNKATNSQVFGGNFSSAYNNGSILYKVGNSNSFAAPERNEKDSEAGYTASASVAGAAVKVSGDGDTTKQLFVNTGDIIIGGEFDGNVDYGGTYGTAAVQVSQQGSAINEGSISLKKYITDAKQFNVGMWLDSASTAEAYVHNKGSISVDATNSTAIRNDSTKHAKAINFGDIYLTGQSGTGMASTDAGADIFNGLDTSPAGSTNSIYVMGDNSAAMYAKGTAYNYGSIFLKGNNTTAFILDGPDAQAFDYGNFYADPSYRGQTYFLLTNAASKTFDYPGGVEIEGYTLAKATGGSNATLSASSTAYVKGENSGLFAASGSGSNVYNYGKVYVSAGATGLRAEDEGVVRIEGTSSKVTVADASSTGAAASGGTVNVGVDAEVIVNGGGTGILAAATSEKVSTVSNSAYITVNQGTGIYATGKLISGDATSVTNSGTIEVGGIGSKGVSIAGGASYSAEAGSRLEIKGNSNCSGDACSLENYTYGVYALSGTVNNSGIISGDGKSGTIGIYSGKSGQVTNTGSGITGGISGLEYGIYVDAQGGAENQGDIRDNIVGIQVAGGDAENSGTISGNEKGVQVVAGTFENSGTISGNTYGIYTKGGTAVNSSNINDYGNYGVYAEGGTVTNNGTIMTTGGTGAYVTGSGTFYNESTITVDGGGTGIHVNGSGAKGYNSGKGTITVNGNGAAFVVENGGTFSNSGTITYNSAANAAFAGGELKEAGELKAAGNGADYIIVGENGTFINNGTVDLGAAAVDFDTMKTGENGKFVVADGGTYKADSFKGDVVAGSDIVMGGFDDTYVNENSFVGKNEGMNISSGSYMFDAELKDNGDVTDVELNRKEFEEIVDDKELADFFETNYGLHNNEKLFDALKGAGNKGEFDYATEVETGKNFYANLTRENMAVLRGLNIQEQSRILEDGLNGSYIGADYYRTGKDARDGLSGYADNVYSPYIGFGEKLNRNWSIGGTLRAAYADAEYDEAKSSRDNKILLAFMPILYQNGGFKFLTMPNVGAGYGTYKRRALSGTYEADTLDFYYGLYNHAEYSIDVKVAELVTEAELNLQGAAMSKAEEDDGLNLDSNSSVSLEAGVGLKLRKRIQLTKERSLMLAIGAKYYHEFLDPYKDLRVGMDGSPVDFGIKAYDEDKNRLKTTAEAVYRDGDFAVAAEVSHNAEKESSIEGGLGVRYNF